MITIRSDNYIINNYAIYEREREREGEREGRYTREREREENYT